MNINRLSLKGIAIAMISLLGVAVSATQVTAQCFNTVYASPYPSGTFLPAACNSTAYPIAPDCYAGEYSLVAVTNGNTYTFSSSTTTDYITISNEGGTTAFVFGAGTQTYRATFSGSVRFYIHTNAVCGAESVNRIRSVSCQAPPTTVFYNNGATIFVGSSTIVQANGIVVNNSGTLTNNGNLTVTGNLTNNGTIIGTVGNLGFNGITAQMLGGTSPVTAKNVIMNNAAGITLATPLRIDGTATFTSGVIDATNSSYPVIFTANGSVSGTPTNASHINGYVRKEGIGTFTYPLGNATNYQPVGVNLTANSGGLTARYVPADAGNAPFSTGGTETMPLVQYNTNEYWDLAPVSTATGSVTVYYDSYRATFISSTTDLRVAHKYNSQWLNEGKASGVSGTTAAGSITSNAVSTWSPFTFGAISAVILPLQWLSLNGSLTIQEMATLSWSVAEKDVKQYEIEKSTDARSYTAIGSVLSKGTGTNTYAFTESTTLSGTAYYRIRQTDINGRSSISAIVKLNAVGSDGGISIYPNPIKDAAQVSIPASLLNTEAGLYNATGQKLESLLLKSQVFTLNLNKYKAGTYLLLLSNGVTAKIIKH